MGKAEGVPLSQVWGTMKLQQKLRVILSATSLQKKWLSVSFSHYGSLYYADDVQQPSNGSYYVKDGHAVRDPKFSVGPTTGRDWSDAGRASLNVNRGPCMSLSVSSHGN